MGRTRILVVTSWYPVAWSPMSGVFVRDQVRALSQQYDVAVVAPDYVSIRSLPQRVHRAIAQGPDPVPTLRPRVISIVPGHPMRAARRYTRAVGDAMRVIQGFEPDLIHAHVTLLAGFAGVSLAQGLRVPCVLTEHAGPYSMLIRSRSSREGARWTLEHADSVIAVSPALRDEMRAVYERPIDVIGNVVDTEFFTPGDETSDHPQPRFAFVGLMTPVKGLDTLIRAVAHLKESGFDDFELLLVGDGPSRAGVLQLARRLDVADHIRATGLLGRDGVRRVLRGADALIAPSRHESFGLVAAEAMACGIPVVASRVGGLPYVLANTGSILVEPGDPVALGEAMRTVVARRSEWDPRAARQTMITRFSPSAFLRSIGDVYAQALGRT